MSTTDTLEPFESVCLNVPILAQHGLLNKTYLDAELRAAYSSGLEPASARLTVGTESTATANSKSNPNPGSWQRNHPQSFARLPGGSRFGSARKSQHWKPYTKKPLLPTATEGLGERVTWERPWSLGNSSQVLGFQGLRLRVQAAGSKGLGFRVEVLGFRISDLGFRHT